MESAAEFGRLAMFPLQSAFLPGEDLPLQIFEPRYARWYEIACGTTILGLARC